MENSRIKLLITITDKNNEKKILKIFNKYKLPFEIVLTGRGTAPSSVLEYFGLNEVKKSIILNIIPEKLETNISYELYNKYKIYQPGKGIAFTIPISSSNKFLSVQTNKIAANKEVPSMKQNNTYHLIITIIKEGYSDHIINLAKKAGAGGGTILNGRALGNEEVVKFFNISIEPEKEIILVLASEDKKNKIMESITENFGLKTDARAICFALPTDTVTGLNEEAPF